MPHKQIDRRQANTTGRACDQDGSVFKAQVWQISGSIHRFPRHFISYYTYRR